MSHYIIYLPGFGDSKNSNIQIKLLKKWQKFGIVPEFQQINWSNNESYGSKFKSVIKKIDELTKQKHTISLIGVSAGATMALNAYSARKNQISKLVFICGKIDNPQKVGQIYYQKNPAFKQSMAETTNNLKLLDKNDKSKIMSIHPIIDEVVHVEDTHIPGAKNKTIFSVGHAISIVLALSIYKRISINFIKS